MGHARSTEQLEGGLCRRWRQGLREGLHCRLERLQGSLGVLVPPFLDPWNHLCAQRTSMGIELEISGGHRASPLSGIILAPIVPYRIHLRCPQSSGPVDT
jgi:hypothetical protein